VKKARVFPGVPNPSSELVTKNVPNRGSELPVTPGKLKEMRSGGKISHQFILPVL